MMTCKQLVEFLADYLDGDLPREQREVFEKHLNCCPPCKDYLHTYRETIRMAKQCMCCGDEAKPESMPESLIKAILAARKEKK